MVKGTKNRIYFIVPIRPPPLHTHRSIIGHQRRGAARRRLIIITIKVTAGIVLSYMVHNNMYYVVTKLIAKKPVDNHNIPSNVF